VSEATQATQVIGRELRVDIARYFAADVGNKIGLQINFLTLTWFTYDLTKSSLHLGILGFCFSIPFLFLSPIAGMMSDRRSRKKILIASYAGQVAIAALIVAANLTGTMTLPVVFAGALLAGSASAINTPALNGILKDFIKDDDLFSRLAGVAAADAKVGQIIGSAVFGFLYSLITASGTLVLYGVSSLIGLIGISGIKTAPVPRVERMKFKDAMAFAIAGRRYLFSHRALVFLVMLTAITVGARGMIFYQLPAIIDRQFDHGFSLSVGMVYTCGVSGGLVGAFILGRRKHTGGLVRWSIAAAALTSISLLAVYFSPHVSIAAIAIALLDMSVVLSTGIANSVLQILTDDSLRGRVLGFNQMSVNGFMSVFSLIAGTAAHLLGMPLVIIATAVMVALAVAAYVFSIPGQRANLEALYAARNLSADERPL